MGILPEIDLTLCFVLIVSLFIALKIVHYFKLSVLYAIHYRPIRKRRMKKGLYVKENEWYENLVDNMFPYKGN